VPGFVDLQVNGIGDVDVASADDRGWATLDAALLRHGTTTWCPTLVSAPLDRYSAPLARIAEAAARRTIDRSDRHPRIAGAHLEGPFLGGAPGAHRRDAIVELDHPWLDRLPARSVAVVTIGPEQDGAPTAIAALTARGVLVALGHTAASEAEVDAAAAAGARMVTHLFNGMTGIHHRELGVAACALTDPRLAASLIADGVHVHPRVLRLAMTVLGRRRAVLVTDAVAVEGGRAGSSGIGLRDGAARLADGTLAGTALTMDAAVRTCVAAGVELRDALEAASTNPALLLGLHDRGVIAPGAVADLVALTPELEVSQVWLAGVDAA